MPYLSDFSSQCTDFTYAITPCTWTKPAMASLFTSLYVDVHQVYFTADPKDPSATADVLSPHFQTMATYFRRHGYTPSASRPTLISPNPSASLKVSTPTYSRTTPPADWTTQTALTHSLLFQNRSSATSTTWIPIFPTILHNRTGTSSAFPLSSPKPTSIGWIISRTVFLTRSIIFTAWLHPVPFPILRTGQGRHPRALRWRNSLSRRSISPTSHLSHNFPAQHLHHHRDRSR